MKKNNLSKSKKKYKYLYKQILDKELIRKAFLKMKKGKTRRKKIIEIANNLDKYVDYMQNMLLNTVPNAEHPERGFNPREHTPTIIMEHGKERKIYVPDIIEQWVHHIIMQVLAPILLKRFHPDSYGSIPNKGLHRGKKTVLKYRHKCKYMLKFDIRHFFANIRFDILMDMLREFIADEWFINLISVCFKWFKKGLPLGFYLSQWLSNLYLDSLDHLIASHGIKHVRYVDDIVMFGNNKRNLRKCFEHIKIYLGNIKLMVKNNYHLYRAIKEPISFLGFIFTGTQVRLRKNIAKNILRVTKRIKKSIKRKQPIWIKDARTLLSYMGWIKHSDGYLFYLQNIQPFLIIKKLKRIISKQERRKNYDKVDGRNFRPLTAIA